MKLPRWLRRRTSVTDPHLAGVEPPPFVPVTIDCKYCGTVTFNTAQEQLDHLASAEHRALQAKALAPGGEGYVDEQTVGGE